MIQSYTKQTMMIAAGLCLIGMTASTKTVTVETTATASYGSNPMAILDGDRTTAWRSDKNDEQAITVDLGYVWPVRSVEIGWGDNYPSEYEVQLTADGKTWETVARRTDFTQPKLKRGNVESLTAHEMDSMFEAKGVRIRCLKSTNGVELINLRINGKYPFCYAPVPSDAVCLNKSVDPAARVQDLLERMTMREKIGMVFGFDAFNFSGLERFGFATVRSSDASAGLRLDWRLLKENISKSTSFPLPSALAAAWQPELAFEMGKAIGEECRAVDIDVLLGPSANIYRTSTCGRNFEYMGEDPYLASRLAVEYIKGVQSQKVIATVKAFAADNNEFVRKYCNAIIDERALHEIYMPAFAASVQEANVRAVMSSYNWLNGEKCGEDKILLTDILRGELGFTGMVMSDWHGAVRDDGQSDNGKILGSGQNMIMPILGNFGQYIRALMEKDSEGTERRISAMIAPTLRVFFEMGIWDRPSSDRSAFEKVLAGNKKVARTIAESAITLLKNDQVLPLTKGQTILITGDPGSVTNASSGGGSAYVKGYDHINFYDGLKAVLGNTVVYEKSPSDETVKNADRILYFLTMGDSEGRDRPFDLPEEMDRQIQVLASKNPNVIVIASTGTGFGMPWLDSVKGLVHGYFLGQEYGAAMANVLTGKVTPSGKLPFTIEKSFSDSPAYGYNLMNGNPWWDGRFPPPGPTRRVDVTYSEGVFVGYRWYEAKQKPVNFPFGFGLSYTTFEISDLTVSANSITKKRRR
jgi:beta-glucosidase